MRRQGVIFRVGWLQRALANLFTLPWWHPVEDTDATKLQARLDRDQGLVAN